jgi:uncharacterized membrane protein
MGAAPRAPGPEARNFRAATAVLPFAAIVQGRQPLQLAELGWRIPLFALLAYGVILWVHPLLFGVDPLDRFR